MLPYQEPDAFIAALRAFLCADAAGVVRSCAPLTTSTGRVDLDSSVLRSIRLDVADREPSWTRNVTHTTLERRLARAGEDQQDDDRRCDQPVGRRTGRTCACARSRAATGSPAGRCPRRRARRPRTAPSSRPGGRRARRPRRLSATPPRTRSARGAGTTNGPPRRGRVGSSRAAEMVIPGA